MSVVAIRVLRAPSCLPQPGSKLAIADVNLGKCQRPRSMFYIIQADYQSQRGTCCLQQDYCREAKAGQTRQTGSKSLRTHAIASRFVSGLHDRSGCRAIMDAMQLSVRNA